MLFWNFPALKKFKCSQINVAVAFVLFFSLVLMKIWGVSCCSVSLDLHCLENYEHIYSFSQIWWGEMVSNMLKPDRFLESRLLSRGMERPSWCLCGGKGYSMGSALTRNRRIPGKANIADILVMENLQAVLYSLRHEGIKLQNQAPVEEPGCLISAFFALRFAVPVKLPVIYVCVLFVFRFRNPSIQQRG